MCVVCMRVKTRFQGIMLTSCLTAAEANCLKLLDTDQVCKFGRLHTILYDITYGSLVYMVHKIGGTTQLTGNKSL